MKGLIFDPVRVYDLTLAGGILLMSKLTLE